MPRKNILYNEKLAAEWSEWVETANPEGSREKELFPALVKWLSRTSPGSIVDIGCGQGIISALIPNGISYLGIDISEPLIARAKSKYAANNKKFEIGDVYSVVLS